MTGFDDFQGTMHAALMLFAVVGTGGVVFAFRERPNPARVLRAIGLTLVLGAVFLLGGLWQSENGWPVGQLVLGVACVWACAFVGGPRLSAGLAGLVLCASLALMLWYGVLVQRRYVGQSAWTDARQGALDDALDQYRKRLLEAGAGDPTMHMPGWLDESELHGAYRPFVGDVEATATIDRAKRLWHTWLTRLYARLAVSRAVYYPGGRVPEGAPRMEWRDRP